MKKLLSLFLLLFASKVMFAQHLNAADKKIMRQKEDSMKVFAVKIIQAPKSIDRFTADSNFTRILIRSLVTKHSFDYPFDSLQTISILYAPDSSFKIFTWQLAITDNVLRHHGVIQMRTYDGSLKIFPLIDKTVVTQHIQDTVGNNRGWIGAIYYKIIQKKSFGQNYYTLLGFDENSISIDRKIIEVLTFVNDEPVFGGRYFSFEEDTIFKSAVSRYLMEYKKDAGPRLTYDPEMDMIVAEHLVSESGEPTKKWTLIGDGDYEGFKWKNGKWVHIEKLYHYVTPMGKEPVPNPIRDNEGNIDESKLRGNEDMQEDPKKEIKPKTATPKKKKGEN